MGRRGPGHRGGGPHAGEEGGTPLRVAIYARNSKPPKGWKPSYAGELPPGSWMTQLADLRRWAERQGHEVVIEEHDMVTGGDPNRAGWARVVGEARGHHVHMIAATKVDRVMRDAAHFHAVVEELLGLGVDLVFIDTNTQISKRDPFSKAVLGILAVIAELELDLARERMWSRMEWRDDGRLYGPYSDRPAGAPRKYGPEHRFRKRGGRLEHDRARCRVCRGVKGAPAATGAAGLAEDGVRGPGGSATAERGSP